ncbi:hypothetical protein CIL05_03815 [Virgibacillus profundi]|uniref:Uncharacterized protein n=1 Tax=Virgibacillus profundi TaxID=2024555 RepID=A0A2A2IHR4_9BACI|nr:hypothetical protein CIL05_03815 [Virgibacillus profundi]PXY55039.1 hypothetical protein CIT14_03895 [Virgibacillus profundi]
MQFIGSNWNTSVGNTRRLLRESEDDETPQRAFFASEEAHREPAESEVYFRSVIHALNQHSQEGIHDVKDFSQCRILYQL